MPLPTVLHRIAFQVVPEWYQAVMRCTLLIFVGDLLMRTGKLRQQMQRAPPLPKRSCAGYLQAEAIYMRGCMNS
jgi:hypothetical protein